VLANPDVIAAVSETLVARLTNELQSIGPPAPIVELHDLVGNIPNDPPRVTLFLYDIVEEPTTRNRSKTKRVVGGDVRIQKQPLGLRLHYMVTAWGGDRLTEQRILGQVLQVLYDDAILDGTELRGSLAGTPTGLRVSLAPLHLEDRSRIWFAIGKNYRLSINYEVRLVDIDAVTELVAAPVRERQLDAGVVA
jgi:uncharacterized protein DUF4255